MFRDPSVCLLVTTMSCAKTAEPVEMPFNLSTGVDPKNTVLGGGVDLQREGALSFFWEGMFWPVVNIENTSRHVALLHAGLTLVIY